jgi:hypothetical protein
VSAQALCTPSTSVQRSIEYVAIVGDRVRVKGLRVFLSSSAFRSVFRDRAKRLGTLFLLSVLIYLPLSFYFPLWMLAIGPLVWGIPHLVSSARFQAHAISDDSGSSIHFKKTLYIAAGVWVFITSLRVLTDVLNVQIPWDLQHASIVEMIAGVFTFVSLALINRLKRSQVVMGSLILVPLFYSSWNYPMLTVGALILLHNFVAFAFWIQASRSVRDRKVAVYATLLFLIIHILMFAKVFDPIINLHPSATTLYWANMDVFSLGRLVAPWSRSNDVWYRCVCLYAFGQASHYFVWLKAIPDLRAPSEAPTSFKTSWNLLKRDVSARPASTAAILIFAPIGIWLFLNFNIAHQFYLAVASYHGYMELGVLALIFSRGVKGLDLKKPETI